MKPSVIVWDLETVPDLGGFAAANDLAKRLDRLERQHDELKKVAMEVEGRLERAMEYIRSLLAADQK